MYIDTSVNKVTSIGSNLFNHVFTQKDINKIISAYHDECLDSLVLVC